MYTWYFVRILPGYIEHVLAVVYCCWPCQLRCTGLYTCLHIGTRTDTLLSNISAFYTIMNKDDVFTLALIEQIHFQVKQYFGFLYYYIYYTIIYTILLYILLNQELTYLHECRVKPIRNPVVSVPCLTCRIARTFTTLARRGT